MDMPHGPRSKFHVNAGPSEILLAFFFSDCYLKLHFTLHYEYMEH